MNFEKVGTAAAVALALGLAGCETPGMRDQRETTERVINETRAAQECEAQVDNYIKTPEGKLEVRVLGKDALLDDCKETKLHPDEEPW